MASQSWIKQYIQTILHSCKKLNLTVETIQVCNSKNKGQHFYIELNQSIEAKAANFLQWLLGDDCRRVEFNRARIDSHLSEWNKLFEEPSVRLRYIYSRKDLQ